MKKSILTIIALSALTLTSCADFLDVKSEGNPAVDNFFNNDQQAIDAMDAIYSRMPQEGVFGREIFWEQGGANDVVWGRTRGYNTLAYLTYTGDESPLRDVFKYCYQIGSRCNWVVETLLDKEASTTLTSVEKRTLGEAYFMRAFCHFYIAYRYGTKDQGVPAVQYELVEGGYNYDIPEQQASVIDNYKMIIYDLQKAEEYLPKFEDYDAANRGRAHKAAAVGYMAKVYAYWATWDNTQWNNVIACVNKLETTYGRDLAPSFSQLFSCELEDFWTKEYIWSLPSNGGDEAKGGGGVEFPGVCLENKGWGVFNGWGQHKPSLDIYNEMAKDNVDGVKNERLARTILEYNDEFMYFGESRKFYSTSDLDAGFQINKWMEAFGQEDAIARGYVNPNGDWPTVRVNFHLLRFADCLLLRAEAYLNTNQAALATADINRVRTRSNLRPLVGTATTADLYHERRCELAFEFTDHLHDCKRWAISGDATIKALALKELSEAPKVRVYEDRSDPESTWTEALYSIYKDTGKSWNENKIAFPYPSEQIAKSNGALKQNKGY